MRFRVLVGLGLLSGRLLGDGCSLGLRYVFLVRVPECWFVCHHSSVFGVGFFF